MSTEEDIAELKEMMASLKQENASLKTRLSEVEEFAQTHVGMDWGTAGTSANVSHPNISADTVETGGGVVRQDYDGVKLISPDAGDALGSALPDSVRLKWYETSFLGNIIGDLLGGYATPTTLTLHSMWMRAMHTDASSYSDASVGVWDEDTVDWLARLAIYDGPYPMVVTRDADTTLFRLEEIDNDNYKLWIRKNATLVEIGSSMKTANTGQYLIPSGPGSGDAVRSGSAASYGSWSGLALADATAPAAPTATAFSSGSTTHNATMPATVNASDLLLAFCAWDSAGSSISTTPPSGWTELRDAANGTIVAQAVYYKVADGTEDGTSVDFATNLSCTGAIHVYRILAGQYEGVPTVSTGATGSSTTVDADAVTPTQTGRFTSFIVGCSDSDNSGPSGTPSGYTMTYTLSGAGGVNGAAIGSGYALRNSNTENPASYNLAGSSAWIACTVAVMASPATTEALYITGLDVDPASTPAYIQIQLGTGAVGAETAIGTYKLMPDDQTLEFLAVVPVATATRISARIATPDSAANHELTLHVINQDDTV